MGKNSMYYMRECGMQKLQHKTRMGTRRNAAAITTAKIPATRTSHKDRALPIAKGTPPNPQRSGLSFWYFARENELFLDLDSPRRLAVAFDRLGRAVRRRFLRITAARLYQSSPGHYHVLLRLAGCQSAQQRVLWQLWLGDDFFRGLYTMQRVFNGLRAPNLLITKVPYAAWRWWDAVCECDRKHRGAIGCPVMQRIHGREACQEYFPRQRRRVARKIKLLPGGRIPLSRL